MTITFTEST